MADSLLVIEDDCETAVMLQQILNLKGFNVDLASDAKTGLKKAYATNPSAIILDIMLPDMDGWEFCARFREMSDTPIIMLTALGSRQDVVKGLDLGADDYIVKPVSPNELAARIRAVLRRFRGLYSAKDNSSRHQIFTYDYLLIDLYRREVTVDGERVELTPTEFDLLSLLARHPGRMLSHRFLLNQVWGSEHRQNVSILHLYIGYLRRKIERDPARPSIIHSEWGAGYRFG